MAAQIISQGEFVGFLSQQLVIRCIRTIPLAPGVDPDNLHVMIIGMATNQEIGPVLCDLDYYGDTAPAREDRAGLLYKRFFLPPRSMSKAISIYSGWRQSCQLFLKNQSLAAFQRVQGNLKIMPTSRRNYLRLFEHLTRMQLLLAVHLRRGHAHDWLLQQIFERLTSQLNLARNRCLGKT